MTGAALFDTYVMVDWSAANQPKRGADSIWIAVVRRDAAGSRLAALENPPTRRLAEARLRDLLIEGVAAGESMLLGCDFPFGYPRGLAARLGLGDPAWRAIWGEIAGALEDDGLNCSNRFEIATAFNRRVSGKAFPFWGCPPSRGGAHLGPRHHRGHGPGEALGERRLVEQEGRVRGPQPSWKLLGVGSAGSQALTGIPVVWRLRHDRALSDHAAVWPFETGLRRLRGEAGRIVLAEIYPSLIGYRRTPGELKDAAQVREIAGHFASLDARGELAEIFAGDPDLSPEERCIVECEEGWILGVTAPRQPSPSRSSRSGSLPLPHAGEGEIGASLAIVEGRERTPSPACGRGSG
jgi:precorrin-8X/cobalt-precorrin-8 methylmutase